MSIEDIRRIKAQAGIPKPKKMHTIAKVSKKKIAQNKLLANDDESVDKWFLARRKELVAVCQCGCGQKSSKDDDKFYRCSICHIFPKRIFKSVITHPLNYVERAFWGGCHSVLDDTSMDRWVGMADWDDIKAKFHAMLPYLTKEEKATKFFNKLQELVIQN